MTSTPFATMPLDTARLHLRRPVEQDDDAIIASLVAADEPIDREVSVSIPP